MELWLEMSGNGPRYQQLYRALRESILSGELAQGDRLPATRDLSQRLGVSRNVVVQAYEQLQAEGFAEGYAGGGTRVVLPADHLVLPEPESSPKQVDTRDWSGHISPLAQSALKHWQIRQSQLNESTAALAYDFRYGDVELDQASVKQWRKLALQYLSHPVIDYADTQGTLELRQAIAGYVVRARGCRCSPEQVCIVNGSQQAIDLVTRLLLKGGSNVLMEDPCYQGAKSVFQVAGAQVQPLRVDDQGLDVSSCSVRPGTDGLIYVTPSHQFPTGAVMSYQRRMELLHWAEQNDLFVLEDDYDSEFRYQGMPIASLQGMDHSDRVIYIGTFSKVLFPALRIGYLILPRSMVQPLLALRWMEDRHTPVEQQQVLARFIIEGHFEKHLRRMRRCYAKRRQALLESLREVFGNRVTVQGTNAGMHILLWCRDLKWKTFDRLRFAAKEQSIGIYAVNHLYATPPEQLGLLMGYASISEQQIAEGVRRLGAVFDKLLSSA